MTIERIPWWAWIWPVHLGELFAGERERRRGESERESLTVSMLVMSRKPSKAYIAGQVRDWSAAQKASAH